MRVSGAALLLSLALAACQTAPPPEPPVAALPPAEPEPEMECIVASRYVQEGVTSWYGRTHHGRRTASGEIFGMNQPSAAHRALPLGTRIRVTNLANNRSIELRVNDRGPHVRGRVLDLSWRVAQALGFVEAGTTRVRIETIETC
jgi:rare lipoprotein A